MGYERSKSVSKTLESQALCTYFICLELAQLDERLVYFQGSEAEEFSAIYRVCNSESDFLGKVCHVAFYSQDLPDQIAKCASEQDVGACGIFIGAAYRRDGLLLRHLRMEIYLRQGFCDHVLSYLRHQVVSNRPAMLQVSFKCPVWGGLKDLSKVSEFEALIDVFDLSHEARGDEELCDELD